MTTEYHDYAAAVTRYYTTGRVLCHTQLDDTAEVLALVNEARQALQIIVCCAESLAASRAMARALVEAEPSAPPVVPTATAKARLESDRPIGGSDG